jgi:hypothetical protein
MMRKRRLADPQFVQQMTRTVFAGLQQFQNRQPVRVTQRLKDRRISLMIDANRPLSR